MMTYRAWVLSLAICLFSARVQAQMVIRPDPERGTLVIRQPTRPTPAPVVKMPLVIRDEWALRAAGLSSTGPALLDFVRRRARGTIDRTGIDALLQQLGDATPAVRERAIGDLVALGSAAIPRLRLAVSDPDDHLRSANARRCLKALEGDSLDAVPLAVVRLLGLRQPAGMQEALLEYVPRAESSLVIDAVVETLAQTAYDDGLPAPALVSALSDSASVRRIVAARALCQGRAGALAAGMLSLLSDPRPNPRLRAALALADAGNEESIATLIALVAELPFAQAIEAHDYLSELAGAPAPVVGPADEASRPRVSAAWSAWWRKLDGPGLLEEVRKRLLSEAERERVEKGITKLGDDAFEVREKAQADILTVGKRAVPLLARASTADPERRQRLQRCLDQLGEKMPPLPARLPRWLAYRKPAGAAQALLGYLGVAEDEGQIAEVRDALCKLAGHDAETDSALVRALADTLAVRRAAAASALARAGGDHRDALKKLLKDEDATVRRDAALTLACRREPDAIPVLINLLTVLPAREAEPLLDLLQRLAGAKAPDVTLTADEAGRRKCRDAWSAWWKTHSGRVQLVRTVRMHSAEPMRHLLVLLSDAGQVRDLNASHSIRWQMDGLKGSVDVQWLPGDRVLVTERTEHRVSERNLKNEILWRQIVLEPIGAQRLANGNTFIATRNTLVETSHDGQTVFHYQHRVPEISAACKVPSGEVVFTTVGGKCVRLDNSGKEIGSFSMGTTAAACTVQVLSDGHVVVPHFAQNKVIEYDSNGRIVWEIEAPLPASAQRLPNGNTLIAAGRPFRVLEVDRAGKVVSSYAANGPITRAVRH
jgi:HEAT repeat protein